MSGGAIALTAASAALAVALLVPPQPSLRLLLPTPPRSPATASPDDGARDAEGRPRRHQPLWSLLAAVGAGLLVGGLPGVVAAVLAGGACWLLVARSEPADVRRRRLRVRRDLPHVVALLAATLRAGAAPGDGVASVAAALPGPAADRLSGVAARLRLGLDPARVWAALASDPDLGRLGRTMARAHDSGAPVVAAVERLADDLAAASRADAEQRARSVGVKAAVPLGLCLLPAFLLVGIVPLAVSLLATLELG